MSTAVCQDFPTQSLNLNLNLSLSLNLPNRRQRLDAFSSPDLCAAAAAAATLMPPSPSATHGALTRPHSFVESDAAERCDADGDEERLTRVDGASHSADEGAGDDSDAESTPTPTACSSSTSDNTPTPTSITVAQPAISDSADSAAAASSSLTESTDAGAEESDSEVRVCIKCEEQRASWACRACEWAVCDHCPDPDGDEACPLCNLRTTESNVPWFLYFPGPPRTRKTTTASNAASTCTASSSGVSTCSSDTLATTQAPMMATTTPAFGELKLASRTGSVSIAGQLKRSSASAARAGSIAAQLKAAAAAARAAAEEAAASHNFPKTRCRLCATDLTNIDALSADHRENCVTEELSGAPPVDEYVRCLYCNMTLPKAYAVFHMLACTEVERAEPGADAERRAALGRQLARQAELEKQPKPEGARERLMSMRKGRDWLVNAFAHKLPYCGREVHELPWRPLIWQALGLTWTCSPTGPLNGLPCVDCQRKYFEANGGQPEGAVLNADGWPARVARDGLFECNRLIDIVDGFANRCSWENGHICDGCERISSDPVFDYLRPLFAAPEKNPTPRHRFRASLENLEKKGTEKIEEAEAEVEAEAEKKSADKSEDSTDSGRSSSSSTSSNNQEGACVAAAPVAVAAAEPVPVAVAFAAAEPVPAAVPVAGHSEFECRMCQADLTGADLRAHRHHCHTANRPPTLFPEVWVRCFLCNLTIERSRARDHMLVCDRVTPEQLQRRSREQMGAMLEEQSNEEFFLPNWLTHHRQYCGQTVVRASECPPPAPSSTSPEGADSDNDEDFEWEWVCERQGDMNGMNCLSCQQHLLADRRLPVGTVLNSDGVPAHLGRDGLFECGRRIAPKPDAAQPSSVLTCCFEDRFICEACARASAEPAFTHLLPLIDAAAH